MKSDVINELFSKYYNEALLYTMSICKDKTLAEDIVSEAFFKALTATVYLSEYLDADASRLEVHDIDRH